MKKLVYILLFFCSLNIVAQTPFRRGVEAPFYTDTDGVTADTGTTISLDDVVTGRIYNKATPSSATSYTVNNLKPGGFAYCYINTSTQPTFTNASLYGTSTWIADTTMMIAVFTHDGTTAQYFFVYPSTEYKSPNNGNDFTGALALNNREYTYYNDYDLETSGTITFAVDTTATTLFGKDYLRIISDGVTQFADSTNVANIFDEIPQGIPTGYVLAEGMYSFYAQQNPSHRSFSLSPVKTQVVIGDDSPFFSDAIFHLDTRKNTPTLDGSEVVSTINIVEPSNIVQNITGANRPTWNAVENSIDFNVNDFMNYDDVFVNRGSHSFLYVGNISALITSSEFTMHYDSEVSSARDFGIKIQGKILTVLNMNPDDSDQISSDSGRPTDPFYGDVMMLVTVDSANEEMVIYIQNEIYSDTVTKAITLDTAAPYNLNHLYNRNNDTTFGVEALTVWNKVMTPAEVTTIFNYYTSY